MTGHYPSMRRYARAERHKEGRIRKMPSSARHIASNRHLYRYGGKGVAERQFEMRYGKQRGDRIYGATVGKVKREREAKGY